MIDFIEIYDSVLSHNQCDEIINFFEMNGSFHTEGKSIFFGKNGKDSKIDKKIKDSTDITLSLSDGSKPSEIIGNIINQYTLQYREKYSEIDKISLWVPDARYNLQRYKPGQGYHFAHCEHTSPGSYRVLAWMIYLNTVQDRGETRFDRYNLSIEAIRGRMCIWPAYWTHTHRGISSPSQTKYIATGWHTFVDPQYYSAYNIEY